MVVKLKTGSSIRGALSYNEQKVYSGKANLLLASGFGCDIGRLGFTERLRRFQLLNERDPKIRTNTLHLSINFPPEERLTDEKMREIATDYMTRIGFGGQPFLVYHHTDTRHQHFHIVTTSVQADGGHIDMNYLGINKSEPARKAIELEYGLIVAQSRKQQDVPDDGHALAPALYGKQATKLAITNIVGKVMGSYKFSSLEEYNIILRQFNVIADRGLPGTRRHEAGGLLYCLLDKAGRKIGVPIKASDIYKEPILKRVERKFAVNAVKKAGLLGKVKHVVDAAFSQSNSAKELAEKLKRRGIDLHIDQNQLGILQTIHFVDHYRKVTFSHKELGLSLNELYRLRAMTASPATPRSNSNLVPISSEWPAVTETPFFGIGTVSTAGLMHVLLRPEIPQGTPGDNLPRKKKKKKKRPSL